MTAMQMAEFSASLKDAGPPAGLNAALQALWWYGRGDWERAHQLAMAQEDARGAAVHALLHRHEGDAANARYWYRRAGRPPAEASLQAEWELLLGELLAS